MKLVYESELYHSAKRKNVKYIAKVPIGNGKYRYFYTQEEYDAYKNSKKPKESKLKKISKSVSKFFKNIASKTSKLFKKTKKEIGDTIEKGRKFVDEVIFGKKKGAGDRFDIKGRKVKYIARVKMSNGKYKYFYDTGAYERYLKRMEYQKNEPDFMKKVPKISEDIALTADEEMSETNPNYSRYDDRYSRNCANCTAAYELRCRGYDVEAAARENTLEYYVNGTTFRYLYYYKDAKTVTIDGDGNGHNSKLTGTILEKKYDYTSSALEKAITSNSGKNTRGDISVTWKQGGGHSMVYEVSKNGDVAIRDCQTNRVYSVSDIASLVSNVSITRTDNLELRKGILDAVEQKGG